jgi:predicted RNase H-like HicB family nuclease
VKFRIEIDCEDDGRWIAEISELPGVMAYGKTRQEAIAKVEALALRVVADQTEERKTPIKSSRLSFACSR